MKLREPGADVGDTARQTGAAGFCVAALLLWLATPAMAADAWTRDTDACNQKATTLDIVQCIDQRTKLWDGRLNQAYKALTAMLASGGPPAQATALKAAQRLWVQYRDANCGFYAQAEGTIRQIEVVTCLRDMTQERAIELQAAGPQ